ncbi:hypothetical protein Sjap_023474 [Stephania japonica]|uniref:alpha-galactosidase n=1 Tax=Stephania japonica TaxID=461633 RepID=A0AAP0HMQ4_9MAGN
MTNLGMIITVALSCLLCFNLGPHHRNFCEASRGRKMKVVKHPPRGWNSYDSFSWIITEEEFLENAKIVSQKLLRHGYQYVVVDYLWYRRKVEGAYTDSLGFDVIDEWGRVIPDPERWPSSRGGKGFSEVAKKVHAMGLKFGIHVMRGISTQAVNANMPILDTTKGVAFEESERQWRARDIGLTEKKCAWMSHGFMSVDTKLNAGRAFLRSLYQQYADWGVDFVKNDCVFGDDLDLDEIRFVSEVLKELDRPIVYSLSPGTSVTPAMAEDVSGLVNMYRITGDDWDKWEHVEAHFNVSSKFATHWLFILSVRDFAAADMIGTKGLRGKSWPDLDMLPLGWLSDPGSNEGPHRKGNLSLDEQRTQMTLWSMAKSPLMLGGDLTRLDDFTYNLVTDPALLEINTYSRHNKEFPYITERRDVKGRSKTVKRNLVGSNKVAASDRHSLHLHTCKDQEASGWVVEVIDQESERLCWNKNLRSKYKPPFCLYKRRPIPKLDKEMIYKPRHDGNFHLTTDRTNFCLDASHNQKLTSPKINRISFSQCKWDANQMWDLSLNGTLVNSYSGLCAMVKRVKSKVEPGGGVRSWIATGRGGEIYVAFFNLNHEKVVISAEISDLAKALLGRNVSRVSCNHKEVWSGKAYGVANQAISASVKMHGSALFVLDCS